MSCAARPLAVATRAETAFEAGDALFERGDRRVADARVDVAVGAQREEFGGMLGRVEDEARRKVERLRARAGRRIRLACRRAARACEIRSGDLPKSSRADVAGCTGSGGGLRPRCSAVNASGF